MNLALSTHWNAARHTDGAALLREARDLGFATVELGYSLTVDLVAGVRAARAEGVVAVGSVHNFCPVPVGAPRGHPDLFALSALDARQRESAILHTTRTIEFAAEMGARAVVSHAGYVETRVRTRDLIEWRSRGRPADDRYEALKLKLMLQRDKRAEAHLDALSASLERLLPVLREHHIRLGLENLPMWEAVPTETEMLEIARRFPGPEIGAWHDVGHGRIRDNLGLIAQRHWLGRLRDRLVGLHLHDVIPPAQDHVMPPAGEIDFAALAALTPSAGIEFVLEPAPGTPPDPVIQAKAYLESIWQPKEEKHQA